MKIKLLTAAALSLFAPLLASAQNADLTMSGAIVPGACTPAFSGGGVIALGRHSAATLNATTQTMLPESDDVSLTIACDVATSILIDIDDNKNSTIVSTLTFPDRADADSAMKMGLGDDGGTNIGMYGLALSSGATVDGLGVIRLLNGGSPSDSAGWRDAARFYGRYMRTRSFVSFSWGNLDGGGIVGVPAIGRQFTIPMRVVPVIRPGDDLDTSGEIVMSGSLTFTVRYM